jgi:hypothetical protein
LCGCQEEVISEEECREALAGQQETERKAKQGWAGKVIVRFLRHVRMRNIITHHQRDMRERQFVLRLYCIRQIERDLFSPFVNTDK